VATVAQNSHTTSPYVVACLSCGTSTDLAAELSVAAMEVSTFLDAHRHCDDNFSVTLSIPAQRQKP
jgi:hypothetical protein